MSRINGDKARFQRIRKRTLKQRERTRALIAKLREEAKARPSKA